MILEPGPRFEGRAPRLQRIGTPAELDAIRFENGVALIELDARLLRRVRFKNDAREDDPRLEALTRAIRAEGYVSRAPIVCRIGAKGKWVVVDGGHRLTAIRRVMGEWWTNLCAARVRRVQFVLFTNRRSWTKARRRVRRVRRSGAEGGPTPGGEAE